MIRLRKPLSYYKEKYGTYLYGLNKLYLLIKSILISFFFIFLSCKVVHLSFKLSDL